MNDYNDIINLEHYEPKYHKRMSTMQRASQFASFQALTGYSDEIKETERPTYKKKSLSDDKMNEISSKLLEISNNIKFNPFVKITYYVRDNRKVGGNYFIIKECVKKIDDNLGYIYMMSGEKIRINDLVDVEILKNTCNI